MAIDGYQGQPIAKISRRLVFLPYVAGLIWITDLLVAERPVKVDSVRKFGNQAPASQTESREGICPACVTVSLYSRSAVSRL